MRTITFYGYKGGSGRTLAVGHIARFMAQLGQRVVAIDFDLDAPGLPTRLRPLTQPQRGLVDLVCAFRDTDEVPPVRDYLLPVEETWRRSDQSSSGSIHILPAGGPVGTAYWKKLTRINWQTFFVADSDGESTGPKKNSIDGKGVPFLLNVKQQIEAFGADYLLIDSRTGVTELGGIAATVLADDLVCLCIHNVESLEGTKEVLATLRSAERLPSMEPLRVFPVLARIPAFVEEEELIRRTMVRLGLQVGPLVSNLVVVHSIPRLEIDDRIRDMQLEYLEVPSEESGTRWLYPHMESQFGEGRLFADYMALLRGLLPATLLDAHLRTLVGEAQARAFAAPERAQEELQQIAYQYPHEHGFRALLQLYRLRSVFDNGALDAAKRLVALTANPAEDIVWDIISHWLEQDEELQEFEVDTVLFCTRVWLARKERATGASGIKLLRLLHGAEVAPELEAEIVEALTNTFRDDVPSNLGLARYFIENNQADRAITLIQRLGAVGFPPMYRLWAQAVALLGSREKALELVNNPNYQDAFLTEQPKLWAEVNRLAGRLDDALSQQLRDLESIVEAAPKGDLSPRAHQRVRQIRSLFVAAGKGDELTRRVRNMVSSRHPAQMSLFRALEKGALIED